MPPGKAHGKMTIHILLRPVRCFPWTLAMEFGQINNPLMSAGIPCKSTRPLSPLPPPYIHNHKRYEKFPQSTLSGMREFLKNSVDFS